MTGKERREYLINISSLKNGTHHFEFKVTPAFFAMFEKTLLDHGEGTVGLKLAKSDTMMVMDLSFDVLIELTCDRSLDAFAYPVKVAHEIIVKFGTETKELSEDVLMIERDTSHFDVAPLINEFICLSVPMKKLHPRYENEETPDIIYQSEPEKEEEDLIDPRWDALKKLNKN